MGIDPKKADLIFHGYEVENFTVGAGIEGVLEGTKVAYNSSSNLNATEGSDQSKGAKKRLDIAIAHLPEHRKKYSSYPEKYAQASKVANTIKMHSSVVADQEDKSFGQLGFNADAINSILRYAQDSLGLNYKSEDDFSDLVNIPVKNLNSSLKRSVTKNFLRYAILDQFVKEDAVMNHLMISINDHEVSIKNGLTEEIVYKGDREDFVQAISKAFSIDVFRINHELDNADIGFEDLAEKITQSYETKLQDES